MYGEREVGGEGWLPHSEDGVLPQPPGGRAGHHLDRREEVVVLHSLSRPPEYQLLHLTSVALDHHPAIIIQSLNNILCLGIFGL